MSTSMLAASEAKRWVSCLERNKQRLDRTLQTLDEGEWDWAPDEGIATVREHLWAIAKSERKLTGMLTRGAISDTDYQAREVAFSEIKKIVAICHRNLVAWLKDQPDREIDPEISEALLKHLDLKSHHASAIAMLSQLIDPGRLPILFF